MFGWLLWVGRDGGGSDFSTETALKSLTAKRKTPLAGSPTKQQRLFVSGGRDALRCSTRVLGISKRDFRLPDFDHEAGTSNYQLLSPDFLIFKGSV